MAKTIADYKADYEAAKAAGDAAGMQAANDGANAIRKANNEAPQYANVDIAAVAKKSQSSNKQTTSTGSSASSTGSRQTSASSNANKQTTAPNYTSKEFADQYAASKGSSSTTGAQNNGYTGVSSAYDQQILSPDQVAQIEQLSAQYLAAKAAGNMDAANEYHRQAEAIRKAAEFGGYSGGGDGSQYIAAPQEQQQPQQPQTTAPQMPTVDPNAGQGLKDYLDAWLEAAKAQSGIQIDYATQKGVLDLQRAEEDAAAQFQTQRDQVSRDERVALDNSALYSEARGDRGGIGEAQYDLIMANAAKNRLAVNQAQTKLSTDTARQIADLRAQGEFKKADQLLELTQTYLSQLMQLEQWGLEYALSATQFNAQMQQWMAEFELSVGELMGNYKGLPTLGAQKADESKLASAGEALLGAGVMPSESQLAAMGMTRQQAQDYITAAKIAAASKKTSGGGNGNGATMTFDDVYDWASQYAASGSDEDNQNVEDYVRANYEALGYDSAPQAVSAWNAFKVEDDAKNQLFHEQQMQLASAFLQQYDTRNASKAELERAAEAFGITDPGAKKYILSTRLGA